MAVTYQSGTRLMANVATKKPDITTAVALVDAAQYPLYAMLSLNGVDLGSGLRIGIGNKRKATNTTISFYQDEYTPYRDTVTVAGYAADATTVPVAHGAYFTRGDIVLNETKEDIMRVEAVSGNNLTVKRDIGGTTGQAGASGEYLRIIGSAFAEDSLKADAISVKKDKIDNYQQIFKTLVSVSGDNLRSADWTEDDLKNQERKKAVEHNIKIEQALLWGKKCETTDENGVMTRTMQGIIPNITTYAESGYGTTLSETEWNEFLADKVFKKGPKEKYFLGGVGVLAAINTFARNRLEHISSDKTSGIAINKYVSPFGILNILHEPLFDGSIYKGYGLVISPKDLTLRPMVDTRYDKNIQENDRDGIRNQYFTETSLQMTNEPNFSLIKGVTSGYAS